MEHIGVKFKSGYMSVELDPDTKKVKIIAKINDTAVSGNVTLKPDKKATKEAK